MKLLALLTIAATPAILAQDLPFPPIKGPTKTLAKFTSEAFDQVFFQQNTKNLTAAIEKYISPQFNITANGIFLPYDIWYENILKQHTFFRNLRMGPERVIVVPFDEEGRTGQAVHLTTISGWEKGLGRFRAQCMSNFRIGKKQDGSMVVESGDGIAAVRKVRGYGNDEEEEGAVGEGEWDVGMEDL